MLRAFVIAGLSLLLLGMQQETMRHALQHDAARLAERADATVHKSHGEGTCAWCALFSAGGDALDVHVVVRAPAAGRQQPALARATSAEVRAPFYYSSRAPPLPVQVM